VYLRAHTSQNQAPFTKLVTKGAPTNLSFGLLNEKIAANPSIAVWFFQNRAEKKGQSYVDANDALFKKLKATLDIVKPQYALVPIVLSYVNSISTFGQIIMSSKSVETLPKLSRGHNSEIWVLLEEPGSQEEPSDKLVTQLNQLLYIQGAQMTLANQMRDYLISGGHVETFLGYSIHSETTRKTLRAFTRLRPVVVSKKKLPAATFVARSDKKETVDLSNMASKFGIMGISEEPFRRSESSTGRKRAPAQSPSPAREDATQPLPEESPSDSEPEPLKRKTKIARKSAATAAKAPKVKK